MGTNNHLTTLTYGTSSYFSESEDLVRNLVEKVLKNVNADLMRKSTENMVESILKGIIKCTSIRDMINEIIDNLPVKNLSEEQLSSVEETASKLMCLQEPQVLHAPQSSF